MDPVKRFFHPKRVDDLNARVIPYINREVTIRGWHENISMKDQYPNDEKVGFVEEFYLDIPESELYPLEQLPQNTS